MNFNQFINKQDIEMTKDEQNVFSFYNNMMNNGHLFSKINY